jgi:hypothetical protein
MAPHAHVEPVLQFPAVQEALHDIDAGLRPAVIQALSMAIRDARHDERRICAKIAVGQVRAAAARGDDLCEDVADGIAVAIVVRDVAEESVAA